MTTNRHAGFTLLEVLVSLLIFGILMTGLMQGTQFGIQAWSAQAHAVDRQQDLDLVDRTMRRLIGTMDPDVHWGAKTLTGNQRSMGFTAAMPAALAAFGSRQVDVIVSVTPAHVLTLRWAPHYKTLVGPPPAPHVTELLSGVDHLELSYYTAGAQGAQWVSEWHGEELPSLIRMRVVFPPGDRRQWPPIVAAVMRAEPW
jgi:general secretion pathway protein J